MCMGVGILFDMCSNYDFFCRKAMCLLVYELKKLEMEKIYESPCMEVVEIHTEQAMLSSSFTGEGINEWEDM